MDSRRMKEEQESFDGDGHATSSIRKRERKRFGDNDGRKDVREGKGYRDVDDYGIATMTSVMDARR